MKNKILEEEKKSLLTILKHRFEKNKHRHTGINWDEIEIRLIKQPQKLWSINEMEITGGEPDVIGYNKQENMFIFCDCSSESPKGRRSVCYDHEALASRKEHKPKNSALNMAFEMGIEILDEKQYSFLQSIESFDAKTSSWLKTPENVRELGGAIFGDLRFGRVFFYHNGAESYYAARGFRGQLKV
ncbi:MAG: DUF4256 domain-containing protein [Bacteroidetes bacterium]|nr:DUF4256 domain-containing protein [Bacteroidota bacterium]MBS1650180.1 DUF4256 domain-containing protein [Bacteroidota bacterium]